MDRSDGPRGAAFVIDRMREADVAEVVTIETASFTSPWPRGAFLDEIRANPYARCMVVREAEVGGLARVSAYICYWILGQELLINNLAVHPARRRRGLGHLLLEHAIEEGRGARCLLAYLEVRPSNAPAIQLYESHGFKVVHRRKGYYSDTNEDALVMRATLKALETA